MPLLAGIDIGTTSTIGIIVDDDGNIMAKASRPCELYSDHPNWAEEEPFQWWENTCAVLGKMLEGLNSADIGGICVTGMVPALVALDSEGQVLRRSIQQNDARTVKEVAEIASKVAESDFLTRTGNGINQQLIAPRLLWLAAHEPDTFHRIASVMGSYDYIAYRLCGERNVEHNWALESGFLDVSRGVIDPTLVKLGGVGMEVVPPLKVSHEVVGHVTEEAARATGLCKGTPVVAGCADHVASAFVANVVGEGDLLIKFGGAGDVLLACSTPATDARMFLDFHIVPGLYLSNGCMAASGSALKWIAREFAAGETEKAKANGESIYARLDRLAANTEPGAGGVVMLPYFLGEKTPIHDPMARGTLVGLGLHHGLKHVWRAALESVVYGFRHHINVFGDMGLAVNRIVASDGGSASDTWMQIAADALGRPVQLIAGHPGSCLGAAYVAGMGVGALDDWAGIERYVRPGRTMMPNAANKGRYDEAYALYRETYQCLKGLYPRFAALGAR